MRRTLADRHERPTKAVSLSPWTVGIVLLGLVIAAALRVWILSHGLGEVDMDEAVSGLMSRHFARGHLSVFFWGQNYGGSQEAMATAVVFTVFGSGRIALKMVPMAGYALSAWLVWRVGRRTVGPPQAVMAAVLFLVGPAFFVLRSTRAYGFYATGLVVCCAVLLVVLRLRERSSTRELAWLGLLVGLGWWATPQVVFVALPAVVWLAIRAPGLLRKAHIVAAGAVTGSLPWLLWSATHNWASLHVQVGMPNNTYGSHLRNFFTLLLPEALGLRLPYSGAWIVGPVLGTLIYAVLLGGFAVLLWKRPARPELLVVVALAYPFLYAISPTSFYTGEPRYLFMLAPVLALLLAKVLATPVRQLGAVGLVVALCVVALGRINGADPLSSASTMDSVLAALDARHVDRVFAPYRIAHRLTFDSRERILVSPIDVVRKKSLDEDVRTSAAPAYVLVEGSPDQVMIAAFLARTNNLGDQAAVGVLHVYVPKAKVLPEEWRQ